MRTLDQIHWSFPIHRCNLLLTQLRPRRQRGTTSNLDVNCRTSRPLVFLPSCWGCRCVHHSHHSDHGHIRRCDATARSLGQTLTNPEPCHPPAVLWHVSCHCQPSYLLAATPSQLLYSLGTAQYASCLPSTFLFGTPAGQDNAALEAWTRRIDAQKKLPYCSQYSWPCPADPSESMGSHNK